MTEHTVIIRCPEGHTQTLHLFGLSREQALLWCGLADGTSPAYVNSPVGTDSLIGKCGVCGRQIEARLEESVNGDPR